jgi:hypothetical protein
MATFRIDEAYDREHGGRFARAVADRRGEFADAWGDIAPVRFACHVWRLATPPALTPGYVRVHRRVIAATCTRNEWDGGLTAHVTLATAWPSALHADRTWRRDRGWRGWPEAFGQFTDPTEHDLARAPHLRSSLTVDAPLPLDGLPPAPAGPHADGVAHAARDAVTAVVRHLNDLLDPLVDTLESAGTIRE